MLRRDGELDLTDAEAALLVRISAATIDRRLGPERFYDDVAGAVPYQTRDTVEVADSDPHLGRVGRRGPRVCGDRLGRP